MLRPLSLVAVAALSTLWVASIASADAIGPCPDGQVVVTNPASPGSMHHGGFHCEPDPNASRCGASPGRGDGPGAALVALAALGLAATRRRARAGR